MIVFLGFFEKIEIFTIRVISKTDEHLIYFN